MSNFIETNKDLTRRLKLKSHFQNKDNVNDRVVDSDPGEPRRKMFIEKSSFEPRDEDLNPQTNRLVNLITKTTASFIEKQKQFCRKGSNIKLIKLGTQDNLTKAERESITKLKNNSKIIIKPSDKGNAVVIMNTENYIIEANRQLDDKKYYKRIGEPLIDHNIRLIRASLQDMFRQGYIDKDRFNYLSGPSEKRIRQFYMLPKIHKKQESWPQPGLMPAGRPIVSDVESETYRISSFIDYYLNPLANKHTTYVKNTYDFIDKIKSININQTDSFTLVTGDITSLYTNMHIDRSIQCVATAFQNHPDPFRPDKQLLDLLEISLKFNDFNFNNAQYLQVMGTAMGKRFAPALANLYLIDWDLQAMSNFHIKPTAFYRYLDDIFFLWPTQRIDQLKHFETFLNSIIPDITVTLEHSPTHINFLDVTIFFHDNQLHTKTYFKDTDTHQLLHKSSHHPRHTFNGLIKSQLIRYKRLSSFLHDYLQTCNILFQALKKRGYSYTELNREKYNIWFNYREKTKSNKTYTDLIPIIIDYTNISKTLATQYKHILLQQDTIHNIKTVIAYKNDRNLKQMLVRTKFARPSQGYFATCSSTRCYICKNHSVYTQTITSHATNKKFIIQDKLTCTSTNIIYLITCNLCKKQYVGQTSKTLRERFAAHKSAILHKRHTTISEHFNLPNHSLINLSIIAIEQSKDSEAQRLRRERHWQNTLRTWQPAGMNGFEDKSASSFKIKLK